MRKEQIYAFLTFGIFVVLFIVSIYFTSARFVSPPSIILPSEVGDLSNKNEYENPFEHIKFEINLENYKDIIKNLSRPTEYSFQAVSTVYAYDKSKSTETKVSFNNGIIEVETDNLKKTVTNELITIESGSKTTTLAKALYTNDEIMGIPTYEAVLHEDFSATKVEFANINQEDMLIIEQNVENSHKLYVISLATGLLNRYENYDNDNLVHVVDVIIS